ncbi:unnamed protein product [Gongylonema pulchrum]|uniref:Uncharacterized protein n=1 Tax=Gongylonema pulchrum TaxID=637853 RepID=A0A183E710_9BILA|nr:unnamed protein product [Gongylonema pulchrum]
MSKRSFGTAQATTELHSLAEALLNKWATGRLLKNVSPAVVSVAASMAPASALRCSEESVSFRGAFADAVKTATDTGAKLTFSRRHTMDYFFQPGLDWESYAVNSVQVERSRQRIGFRCEMGFLHNSPAELRKFNLFIREEQRGCRLPKHDPGPPSENFSIPAALVAELRQISCVRT